MRSERVYSKYAFVYYSYFKEFAIKYKEHAAAVFLDNKANVPVGELSHAVATNVRLHNKSLTSSSVALNQDRKVAGLVPFVCCFIESNS